MREKHFLCGYGDPRKGFCSDIQSEYLSREESNRLVTSDVSECVYVDTLL